MMFEFLRHEFGAADKSQGTTEKNKEKVEANCTGFSLSSQQLFGSHSVEMLCFEFETIYVKTSKNMSNPTKIQLSYFG